MNFWKPGPIDLPIFSIQNKGYVSQLGATVQLSPSIAKTNTRFKLAKLETDVTGTEKRRQVMLLEFFNHPQKLDNSQVIFRQNNLSEATTPPIYLLAKAHLVSQVWPYSSLIHSHLLALSSPSIPLQIYQVWESNSQYSLNQRVLKPIEIKHEQNYALQVAVMLSVYFLLILWGALRSKSLHLRLAST